LHPPANWRGICKRSMGAVLARTSTLRCVVKHFLSRSARIGLLTSACTTYGLTEQAATAHTIAITRPHLTIHSSPCTHLCPPAEFGDTSPSAAACGAHYEHVVSSRPTTLPFDRRHSVAACRLLYRSSIINQFHDSIIKYDDKLNLTTLMTLK